MIDQTNDSQQTRYITVSDWNKYHPWPPQGGIRHLIFHAKSNGFLTAFKKVGKRVLIDEREFFNCLAKQNMEGK